MKKKVSWWRLCLRPKTCKEFETWADNIIALTFEFSRSLFIEISSCSPSFFLWNTLAFVENPSSAAMWKSKSSQRYLLLHGNIPRQRSQTLSLERLSSVNSFCTIFCFFLMLTVFILVTTKLHPLTRILYAHYLFPKASGMQSHLVFKVLLLKLYSKIGSKIFWILWLNVLAAVAEKTSICFQVFSYRYLISLEIIEFLQDTGIK